MLSHHCYIDKTVAGFEHPCRDRGRMVIAACPGTSPSINPGARKSASQFVPATERSVSIGPCRYARAA